jgi:hypothetical protein
VACVESIPGLSDESSHIPFFAFGQRGAEEGRQREREGTRGVGLGHNSAMSSLEDFISSQLLLLVDRSPQVSFFPNTPGNLTFFTT